MNMMFVVFFIAMWQLQLEAIGVLQAIPTHTP